MYSTPVAYGMFRGFRGFAEWIWGMFVYYYWLWIDPPRPSAKLIIVVSAVSAKLAGFAAEGLSRSFYAQSPKKNVVLKDYLLFSALGYVGFTPKPKGGLSPVPFLKLPRHRFLVHARWGGVG